MIASCEQLPMEHGVVYAELGRNGDSLPAWANRHLPRKYLPQSQSRNRMRGCVARVPCPGGRLLSSAPPVTGHFSFCLN